MELLVTCTHDTKNLARYKTHHTRTSAAEVAHYLPVGRRKITGSLMLENLEPWATKIRKLMKSKHKEGTQTLNQYQRTSWAPTWVMRHLFRYAVFFWEIMMVRCRKFVLGNLKWLLHSLKLIAELETINWNQKKEDRLGATYQLGKLLEWVKTLCSRRKTRTIHSNMHLGNARKSVPNLSIYLLPIQTLQGDITKYQRFPHCHNIPRHESVTTWVSRSSKSYLSAIESYFEWNSKPNG